MAVPDVSNNIRCELRQLQSIIGQYKQSTSLNVFKNPSSGVTGSGMDQAMIQGNDESQSSPPELRDTSFFAAELQRCTDQEHSKEITLSQMERMILNHQDQSYGPDA